MVFGLNSKDAKAGKPIGILGISSKALKRVFTIYCTNRLRYSRERVSQRLPADSDKLEKKLEYKRRQKAAASAGLAGFAGVGGPPPFPRDGMRVGSNGERVPFGRPLGVLRPATYEEPAAVRFHRGEKYHPSESNPADFLAPLKSP